jgi:sugar phosphate isomerase/epimerase
MAHAMGIETIVCPLFYIPDRFDLNLHAGEDLAQLLTRLVGAMTERDWYKTADYLNAKGAALKRVGLRFAYHNHNAEFAPVGGTTGMAILLSNTDPKLVSFEMDAGWVAAAGVDPVTLLRAHPGRFTGMHIKDIAASTVANFTFKMDPSEVGHGTLDWSKLLAYAYAAGVREYYVEQEPPFAKPPLEEAAASLEFLRGVS